MTAPLLAVLRREEVMEVIARFEVVAAVVVERPAVRVPRSAAVAERLVEEAVVAKKLVVVALVPVAFRKVKFWRVEEARVWRPPSALMLKSSVPAELTKERNLPIKLGVEEALIKVPVVPVAFTWKRAALSREAVVVAPTTKDLKGEEVAERKSPPERRAKFWPKVVPPVAASPSQREAEPVMETQKSERADRKSTRL